MTARILIVEDNDMSFVLADYLLRQKGYSTLRAADGGAGVADALEQEAQPRVARLRVRGQPDDPAVHPPCAPMSASFSIASGKQNQRTSVHRSQ